MSNPHLYIESEPDISLEVPAKLEFLPAIGHFVKALFTRHPALSNCSEILYGLELSVYESCTNVIRHAYSPDDNGSLQLKIWLQTDKVIIHVVDFGIGFDPNNIPTPKLDKDPPVESGLGLYIIRSTVDEFYYCYSQQIKGNVLQMVKKIK